MRIAAILSAPAVLVELGVDPGPVIAEAGLDPAVFDDAENTLPFRDVGRFLDLCVTRTTCPDFGLRVGATMSPDILGLIGALGNAAPDVGTALRELLQFFHLHDRGSAPAMRVCGEQVQLCYTFHEPEVPATGQIYDIAIMYGQGIKRNLAGPHWRPIEVRLSRPRPENIQAYRYHFGNQIRFDAGLNANVFATSWLDCPVVGADAPSHQALEQLVVALDGHISADLVAQPHATRVAQQ